MEHERCEACGFDGSLLSPDELLARIRSLGPRWRVLLEASDPELRLRPAPETWSAIEYAAAIPESSSAAGSMP